MTQSKALVGQDFGTDLDEDFKSEVKFCTFTFRAKAGEDGWVARWGCSRQVSGLVDVLPWPWVPDSPNLIGKCL